jgi:hypothetical protein
MNKPWTPADLSYITDNWQTQTDAQLAAHLNRSPEAVSIIRRRRLRLFRKWTVEEVKVLLANADKSAADVAGMLPGRTRKAVEHKRYRTRLVPNQSPT